MSADRPTRRSGRLLQDRGGATAVEFALALPIFIAMVFGIIQFGWAQHCNSSLRFAIEKASRALLLNPALSESDLQAMVQSTLAGVSDTNVTVHLQVSNTAAGKVANLTGLYSTVVGIPALASFPINYSTTVSTPLP